MPAGAMRDVILSEALGTWHGLFQDIPVSPTGLYAPAGVAMATGDVDVYAQALLPTPRETSSRNTRSKCQTILVELFTGSPTGNDPIVLTRRRDIYRVQTVHRYRRVIPRRHFFPLSSFNSRSSILQTYYIRIEIQIPMWEIFI